MAYAMKGAFPANESSYEDREAALRMFEFSVRLTLRLTLPNKYISLNTNYHIHYQSTYRYKSHLEISETTERIARS